MARIGIVFGLLLCMLAGAGMCGTTTKLPSQIVPMMVGIPMLFLSVVGLNPHRRRLSMFSAAVVSSIGFFGGSGRAIYWALAYSRGESVNTYALRLVLGMAVLCLLFLVAYSVFVARVRARKSTTNSPESSSG